MKLHHNLINAVVNILQKVFKENRFADIIIQQTLKSNSKWGSRDRKFIAETSYEIIRWWRLLWSALNEEIETDEKSLCKLIGAYFLIFQKEILSDSLINGLNKSNIFSKYEEVKSIRKFRESIPDWLDELGEYELDNKWEIELHHLNKKADVVLRTNTLKITSDNLQKKLLDENIETSIYSSSSDALILNERKNVFTSNSFKDGLFEVQDVASQMVSPFLEIESGMRVIDACAGGGGKSLHIACLMKNIGKIIALDTEEWKLNELKKRAVRNGVNIIETRLITSNKIIKRLFNSADRLLLDVPCSGIGVLRRNPDAKWKLSLEKIEALKKTQNDILNFYSEMVKTGGKIVYSTCSIFPSENEKQIQKFLDKQNGKYELVVEKNLYPSEFGFDGFYIALLKRCM